MQMSVAGGGTSLYATGYVDNGASASDTGAVTISSTTAAAVVTATTNVAAMAVAYVWWIDGVIVNPSQAANTITMMFSMGGPGMAIQINAGSSCRLF